MASFLALVTRFRDQSFDSNPALIRSELSHDSEMDMHRYWVEFDFVGHRRGPAGTALGCGVTAVDQAAALKLLEEVVFEGDLPPISVLREDVAVDTLDARHVRPNMGNPAAAGIWFPLGYS